MLQPLKDVRRIATRKMNSTIREEARIRVAKVFEEIGVDERGKAKSESGKFTSVNSASNGNHLCPRQQSFLSVLNHHLAAGRDTRSIAAPEKDWESNHIFQVFYLFA